VAVAAVGVFRVLALLFSRAPSLSSRRRTLLEAIEERPGVNLLELRQATGIPIARCATTCGSSRAAATSSERRQGRKRRFFENHGRYGDEWQALALLRDPALRQLHELLLTIRRVGRPGGRPTPTQRGDGAQHDVPPPRPPREGRPRGERNRRPRGALRA